MGRNVSIIYQGLVPAGMHEPCPLLQACQPCKLVNLWLKCCRTSQLEFCRGIYAYQLACSYPFWLWSGNVMSCVHAYKFSKMASYVTNSTHRVL